MSRVASALRSEAPLSRWGSAGVLAGLVASAAALAVAPLLMPADYSWVSQTTSESAAQDVPGAWLARVGFATYGSSVLVLSVLGRRVWGRWGSWLHAGFGALMTMAAVFSHRPWGGAPYNRIEDLLHSVAASTMGIAFVLGVLVVATRRRGTPACRRLLNALSVAVLLIPLGMLAWPQVAGVLQRLMFGVSYVWYGAACLDVARSGGPRGTRG